MRRLPVYFLIDVSDSMVGDPLKSVQQGLVTTFSQLCSDPYALETVALNVIVFAGKVKKIISMEEVFKCTLPELSVGSGTCFGAALEFLMSDIESNVKTSTSQEKGDWKPIIFIFTDGASTDSTKKAITHWKSKFANKYSTILVAVGDGADIKLLSEISSDIIKINELDSDSFTKFFQWVSSSVQASSVAIERASTSKRYSSINPELLEHFNIERIQDAEHSDYHPDNNYVILRGRCQTTQNDYLLKFKLNKQTEQYDLIGTYPINGAEYDELSENSDCNVKINVDMLNGVAPCPLCGNSFSFVLCGRCGRLFCARSEGICTCPWCGNSAQLETKTSFDITRSLG